MPVGLGFENYADCSDFCVFLGSRTKDPRREPKPLVAQLFGDRKLKVLFQSDKSDADIPEFKGAPAVKDKKQAADSEALMTLLYDEYPSLKTVFGHELQQPTDLYKMEKGIKTDAQHFIVPLVLSGHFARQAEKLHVLITAVGEFLQPSCAPEQAAAMKDMSLMNDTGPFGKVFKRYWNTRVAKLGTVEQLKLFETMLIDAQGYQMVNPPDLNKYPPHSIDTIGHVYNVIRLSRHVLAHCRDDSGNERRFVLRSFANVFGNGRVVDAIEFISDCFHKLKMDSKGQLFDAIVNKDSTARDKLLDTIETTI